MRKADALSGMSAKSRVLVTIAVILVVGLAYTQQTLAAQRYVDANSANPVPPFATWQTAARTIQDAVDLSVAGDEILVTNGVYATGRGGMAPGSTLTNRACIDKAVAVRSVNGPLVTTIEGYQTTPRWADSAVAVRCAYLADGAVLEGFTLTKGDTRDDGDLILNQSGGGVFCQGPNSLVSRCIIEGNVAYGYGGGAFGGRLENCLIVKNSATNGACGACSNVLVHCTVTGNGLGNGVGGVRGANLFNSIVWQNTGYPENYGSSTFDYSCSTPLPPSGTGNISSDPQFENSTARDWHLRSESPCIDKGNNTFAAGSKDLDGSPRQVGSAVDMGAYEFGPVPPYVLTEPEDYTVVAGQSAVFTAVAEGSAPITYQWWFGNQPIPFATSATLTLADVQTAQAGSYYLAITNQFGWTNSRTAVLTVVEPVTHYVDVNSPNPVAPFTSWATAARVIQDAVDAAGAGDHILVTNGVYDLGGKSVVGALTNRVALYKPVTLRSINGAAFTTIQGRRADSGTNGPGAIRCAYLTNGASLIGFTLTGGATLSAGEGALTTGGGAWCASNAVISHCVVKGNTAFIAAGGVGGGVLDNCVLFGNSAASAGAAMWSTLWNCTVMGNSAQEVGGIYICTVWNSIVISNTASVSLSSANHLVGSIGYSCTAPLPSGVGNVCFDPRVQDLAGGDLRLRSDSPCIGRGNNAVAVGTTDLDGNPRIYGTVLDMGAYEYQGVFTPSPPSIVLQPTNQTVLAGDNALFAVVGDGTAPLSYQWRFNGTDLFFQTNSLLVITNVQAVDAGGYSVKITNQGGDVVSETAVLSLRTPVIRYVDAGSLNPQPPFSTWANAARTLQDAADLSLAGDEIVATNGIYSSSGRYLINATNRILIPARVAVRSVNGPAFTTILGETNTRCVYLEDFASLVGFTLTRGQANDGGGAFCLSTNAFIANCIIVSNSASGGSGGGVYGGTLTNCTLAGNSASYGGGAASGSGPYSCALNSCVISSNSASYFGGGTIGCRLNGCLVIGNTAVTGGGVHGLPAVFCLNCTIVGNTAAVQGGGIWGTNGMLATSIVYHNKAASSEDMGWGSRPQIMYCCTPQKETYDTTLVTNEPAFVDLAGGNLRLTASSLCINAGANSYAAGAVDLDGNPRIHEGVVDIGAYEFQGTFVPIPVTITQQPMSQEAVLGDTVTLTVVAEGTPPLTYQWQFEGANVPGKTDTVLVLANINTGQFGTYTVRVTGRAGPVVSNPAIVSQKGPYLHYVDANSANPTAPFRSWATAARTIQDAVDVASAGDEIVVTNGVYASGGRVISGTITNRVAVTNTLVLRSVNGPAFTTILGETNTRCVYLGNAASVTGFTLTRGQADKGGGAFCLSTNALISNCIILSNIAVWGSGGGVCGGTITNCTLTGNTAHVGGGAARGWGQYPTVLNSCVVSSNSAISWGGGVADAHVNGCLIIGNTAETGGGVYASYEISCLNSTIVGNAAVGTSFFVDGGGIWATNGIVANSIIYYNTAPRGENLGSYPYYVFMNCCTPQASGWGNITSEPAFVDLAGGNLRLSADSPCINAGTNIYAKGATDLDGLPRIVGPAVDIGAYEFQGAGSIRYVNANSPNPAAPYKSWATAARTIQDAVDVASAGDEIVVTNGVYASGGRVISGTTTNRVAVTNTLVLRSVNGPAFTTILGETNTRCVYLGNGASMAGFTLTGGQADQGAGVYGGTLTNCTLTDNTAYYGGGAARVELYDCEIRGNSANEGGGALGSGLTSCLVISNSATYGGGVAECYATNCTLLGNSAQRDGGGAYVVVLDNCLVISNSASSGGGAGTGFGSHGTPAALNLKNCTVLGNRGGGTRAAVLTNCIVYYNEGYNIDSYAPYGRTYNCCTTPLPDPEDGQDNVTDEPLFVSLAAGDFHLQPGSPCIDTGANIFGTGATDLDGFPRVVGPAVDIGAYEFQGAGSILYVDANSANPTAPFKSWGTAARTIQDAVDVASAGEEVLVTNGVYASGGRLFGTLSNRVFVAKAISLRSVNGPRSTVIEGYPDPATDAISRASNSVRCVYLATGASLSGFTLTNGSTRTPGPVSGNGTEEYGGGVYCESTNSFVSNCILVKNSANLGGGGAYRGTLRNCLMLHNGAYWGGGAAEAVLFNCTVVQNGSTSLYGVHKLPYTGPFGAGTFECAAINTIIYDNAFYSWYLPNYYGGTFTNCCTTPVPVDAVGTIESDPLFVNPSGGDFRLTAYSPCINAGANIFATSNTDLDGQPRIVGAAVDIGAYEFQGGTAMSLGDWLAGYGLPSDGSADYVDSDGDGANNWQEWRASTNPTNAASALRLLSPISDGTNILVQWESAPGIGYSLERSASLEEGPGFSVIATNLFGAPDTNYPGTTSRASFTDTNAAGAPAWLYRVRVKN
jgi:parallel beta-helix repeat protein